MATSYVVTATRLYTLDDDGFRVRHSRGETVTGLSDADVKRHKAAGNIAPHSSKDADAARDDAAGPNAAETSTGDPTVSESHNPEGGSASELMAVANSDQSAVPRPAKAADLATWQSYARGKGVELEDADGKAKTKGDLQAETAESGDEGDGE